MPPRVQITDGALSQFVVAAERTARSHGHAVLVGNLAEGGAAVVQMLIDAGWTA